MCFCSTSGLHFDPVELKNFDVFFRDDKRCSVPTDSRGGNECIANTRLPTGLAHQHESNAAIAEKDIKIKRPPEGVRLRGHQLATLVEEVGRLESFHQFVFDFRVGVSCFAVTRFAGFLFRLGQ